MRWASTIDTSANLAESVTEACARLFATLERVQPDLILAFVSSAHAAQYEALPALIAREFDGAVLIGCSGSGVIGSGREIESGPALALTAATLPDVRLTVRHVETEDVPPVYAPRSAWMKMLGPLARDTRGVVLLCDPFSVDAEHLLQGLDRAYPECTKIGGLASGGASKGTSILYANDTSHRSGFVSLTFEGNLALDCCVAQGCRPISEPLFVTAVHENLIRELDARSARDVLAYIYDRLPDADREPFATSLSVGIALPGERSVYGPGDFLIRNVLGLDAQSGALWVGARIPERTVIQFHLRDPAASTQDLEQSLSRLKRTSAQPHPSGALLFSCVGRGVDFYGQPDHDSNALRRMLGDLPIGGFFCSGEIGPVHAATFVHGYTSVVGLFSPRDK